MASSWIVGSIAEMPTLSPGSGQPSGEVGAAGAGVEAEYRRCWPGRCGSAAQVDLAAQEHGSGCGQPPGQVAGNAGAAGSQCPRVG